MRPTLALAALLLALAPSASAVTEGDAPNLRSDVGRAWHAPPTLEPGKQWQGFLALIPGHAAENVSFQICRVGEVCFTSPVPAQRVNNTTWTFDTSTYLVGGTTIDWQPGWRIGVQWILQERLPDGSVERHAFPEGVPLDSPECASDALGCAETHYIVLDVGPGSAAESGMPRSWWFGLAAGGALLAGLLFWRHRVSSPIARRAVLAAAAASGLLVVMGGGWVLWDAAYAEQSAPEFQLQTTGYLAGGGAAPASVRLSDYRGDVLVLDLMAVSCTSCRVVTQEVLLPLHDRYGDRDDFAILSVDTWADPATGTSWGETTEEVVALQQREGAPWPHALDTDRMYVKYAALQLPKVVVIDPEGRIVYEATGKPSLDDVDRAVTASLAREADAVPVLRVGLVGLALVAGLASFFSPCSVGLLPAYLGFLLQSHNEDGRARKTLRGGLATGAGIVTMYAAIAVLLWPFGPFLRPHLGKVGPVIAVVLVVLGLLMLRSGSWEPLARRLWMGRVDGRRGFFAFGLGYGLAAFGCTGPVLFPVLIAGFVEGAMMGVFVFLAYAASVAFLVVGAAALVAAGRMGRLSGILAKSRWINRASAMLLVVAGVWMLVYYWRAGTAL